MQNKVCFFKASKKTSNGNSIHDMMFRPSLQHESSACVAAAATEFEAHAGTRTHKAHMHASCHILVRKKLIRVR